MPKRTSPSPLFAPLPSKQRPRTVILGAGIAGRLVLEELARYRNLGYIPVGFLDDDQRKHRRTIGGLPVWGPIASLPKIARAHRLRMAVLAIPSASGEQLRRINRLAQSAGLELRVVPGFYEVLKRDTAAGNVRPIALEDLFRRKPIPFDTDAIRRSLTGKTILITGAAGSIGQELCRQLAAVEPRQLLLLDHEENNLYDTYLSLRERFPSLTLQLFVGDIRDRKRMRSVFSSQRPDLVYHAAAYKHVPIMEFNPLEAIKTNVLGTGILVDEAVRSGVERFVLISTDKAVNPSCVMGACKRLAEIIVRAAAPGQQRTAVMVVRFGNVMSSRGNVVERFTQQIAKGGPVTVTHPQMRRYFMTREEAAQLVMQASAVGRGGELFVLDMGAQVLVMDVAREMIRLEGLRPGTDVPITLTGVRPGEKLREELLTPSERKRSVQYRRMRIVREPAPNRARTAALLRKFAKAVAGEDPAEGKHLLHHYIPTYQEPGYGQRTSSRAARGGRRPSR